MEQSAGSGSEVGRSLHKTTRQNILKPVQIRTFPNIPPFQALSVVLQIQPISDSGTFVSISWLKHNPVLPRMHINPKALTSISSESHTPPKFGDLELCKINQLSGAN